MNGRSAALVVALLSSPAMPASAQESLQRLSSAPLAPTSGLAEDELRYLQGLGIVRRHPWSLRAFSNRELATLLTAAADTSWRTGEGARVNSVGGLRFHAIPLGVRAYYNTAFPYGMNDGPVWQGRGLTTVVSGGMHTEWGPLQLRLAPLAFSAENRSFGLLQTVDTVSEFADALHPLVVDRPQRFGAGAYRRVDPGESYVALTGVGLTAGVSTANEWWGPMSEFPFILGTNAPGFPHVFAGSSRPWNAGIGRIHARIIYGDLAQTAYSTVPADSGRRFAGGAIAIFEPLMLPGLELGAARFYHITWPERLRAVYFMHLFESLLKNRIGGVLDQARDPSQSSIDNQLASAFGRWVFPRSGFEIYAEYGREDHNVDAYDLLQEPDHSATVGMGARKAWQRGPRLYGLRIETINHQSSSLLRHRSQGGAYTHVFARQGHTHRGQLLGTGIAAGNGAGATMALSRFDISGQVGASLSRFVVRDEWFSARVDVQYVARVERTIIRPSSALRYHFALDGVFEVNRYFGADQGNLRAQVFVSWLPGEFGSRGQSPRSCQGDRLRQHVP